MISGRANLKIPRGLEDGRIFVGRKNKPYAVIKRKEIKGYLTAQFWHFYKCWTRFDLGFGLPSGGAWGDYTEGFIAVLESFSAQAGALRYGKND